MTLLSSRLGQLLAEAQTVWPQCMLQKVRSLYQENVRYHFTYGLWSCGWPYRWWWSWLHHQLRCIPTVVCSQIGEVTILEMVSTHNQWLGVRCWYWSKDKLQPFLLQVFILGQVEHGSGFTPTHKTWACLFCHDFNSKIASVAQLNLLASGS